MKTFIRQSGALFVLLVSLSASAWAVDEGTILVRAKAGPILYSGLEISSTFGVGADVGLRGPSGIGVTFLGQLNLAGTHFDPSTGDFNSTEIKSVFLGMAPGYSVGEDSARLTLDLGFGALATTKKVTSFPLSGSSFTTESSDTRFALAPGVQADFDIKLGIFATFGVRYIVTFGEVPRPALLVPAAGIGVHL